MLEAEVARLAEALKGANAHTAKFERLWYLRGDEIERLREVLGNDQAGRPFDMLLTEAADYLRQCGGGPMEDCLRAKAEQVRDALNSGVAA